MCCNPAADPGPRARYLLRAFPTPARGTLMRLVRQAFSLTGAFTLILGAVTPFPAQAPSPLSGTWKLNLAKSTYSPANLAPKSTTAVYTVTATDITVSTEGVDAQGRATRSEYT